ncbi:MAG TPA: hypothetical protein VN426_16680 [Syntrophomonadaceae bacterium]|nr:hypothetical protein [Syntrophomonadaceae bacterium]
MNVGMTRELHNDLLAVNEVFKSSIQPWWNDVLVYHEQVEKEETFALLPALTLAVFDYMGHKREVALVIASIVKLFYFNNRIVETVKDDEEGQVQDQNLQFSILIGDYVLGSILKLLVENEVDSLLKLFSDMMAQVNQGLVEKYKLSMSCQEIIMKSRIPIYQTAFLAAARLGEVDPQEEARLKQMGLHVGMAVELLREGNLQEEARLHIHGAEALLKQMGKCNETHGSSLAIILRGLHEILCSVDQAAAI